LVWPFLLLAGLEHVRIDPGNTALTPLDFYDYPFTHSLAAVLAWSAVFGVVFYARRHHQIGAWLLGMGVASHWFLDALVHRPDLPLWPGGPLVGLGLWRSVPLSVAVETAMLAAGVLCYVRARRPLDRTGQISFWSFVGFLYAIYLANVFGPPPPSIAALEGGALATWLFVPWAYWIDRHREEPRRVT
jgi:hypothetical protein